MTGEPVVAVHLVSLYEAVCHSCGWASPMEEDYRTVSQLGEYHALFCTGQPRPG